MKNDEDSMTDSPKETNSNTGDKLAHFEYDERKFFNGTEGFAAFRQTKNLISNKKTRKAR